MKTIVLGLIFLGFTNLMQSQNDVAYINVNIEKSAKPIKSAMINPIYFKSLGNKISSVRMRKFQEVVANYDIKKSEVYSLANSSNYTVVFEEGDNQIKAEYDSQGQILNCSEQFKNIKLPSVISRDIAKNYPGWEFKQVVCTVNYEITDNQQVIYNVKIQNGKKTKTLNLNVENYNL